MRNIVFIGGGNMAQALVGGLVKAFDAAAAPCAGHVAQALQVSVMAGVRSDAIVAATGSERVIRVMPNTPALIGQGIAGLFARAAVTDDDRADAIALLAPTGELIWVGEEVQLDAVTALSGSGPAYVFLLLEALTEAGRQMGLPAPVARRLAEQTVAGSAALAAASPDSPAELRRIVTSPGGTTEAAMAVLDTRGARDAFIAAVLAARAKAEALGKPAVAPRSTLLPPSP